MTPKKKWLFRAGMAFIVTSPFLLFLLGVFCHLEAYCFFYPGIDTRYAPGYSESVFSLITTGITAEIVEQKLGAPLYAVTNRDATIRWSYTDDGKCAVGSWRWADFAWLGREVTFREGKVIQVYKHVYYD